MVDELDQSLIALLRADSRAPAASLAKALKVSRGTVQNRIERLTARGVIPDFRNPDGIRVGLAPLYTRFTDVHDGLAVLRDLL